MWCLTVYIHKMLRFLLKFIEKPEKMLAIVVCTPLAEATEERPKLAVLGIEP